MTLKTIILCVCLLISGLISDIDGQPLTDSEYRSLCSKLSNYVILSNQVENLQFKASIQSNTIVIQSNVIQHLKNANDTGSTITLYHIVVDTITIVLLCVIIF